MIGEQVLVGTLNARRVEDSLGNHWQYLSRSDTHSKAICWGILFDLLDECPLLREHIALGRVRFGINHEMVDFVTRRDKKLDLVLTIPLEGDDDGATFEELIGLWGLEVPAAAVEKLQLWPVLRQGMVGRVLLALEAKACMTAHSKAAPRLYDELASAFQCINGASRDAVAIGHVVVNGSETFISSSRNFKARALEEPEINLHTQPAAVYKILGKVMELPVRGEPSSSGYDGLAITVVNLVNDGTPAFQVTDPPALPIGDSRSYQTTIHRAAATYNSRFRAL